MVDRLRRRRADLDRFPTASTATRDVLAGVALALLLVVAVVLTGAALSRRSPSPGSSGTPESVAPGPVASSAGSSPSGAGSPSPRAGAAARGPAGRAVVLAGTDVVEGTGLGSCATAPTLTWAGRPVELPPGHLLRLRPLGERRVLLVLARGARCAAPLTYTTDDAGAHWSSDADARRTWYLRDGGVHAPGDEGVAPCRRADELVAVDARAAFVRCGKALRRTADGGHSWADLPAPPGTAAAVAAAGSDVLVAVSGADGCAGIAVLSLDGDAWTRRGCARGARGDAATSLAAAGPRLVLRAAGLLESTDGGRTWSPSS